MADEMPGRATVLALRRSPAQHLADDLSRGSGPDVSLRELPFLTQIALRAAPGTPAHARLASALGLTLPGHVGAVTVAGSVQVLWLAPDEFLVVAPDEAESGLATADFVAQLGAALGSGRGQVVDVSANRATFELAGRQSRTVLDKSVRLDLHPRAFPVGSALVTQLGETPAILWRTDEHVWRVLVRASFAGHVAAWLLDGMREFV